MWLFIPFVVIPIVEIALFIQVGGWIGLWPTLMIVILTAVAGTVLVRGQGLAALARLQAALRDGGDPTGPIAHGALILAAGLLLLTPGFFTDAVGFSLLAPPVRSALIRWGAARLAASVTVVRAESSRSAGPGRPPGRGDVIEGEAVEIDRKPRDGPASGWTRGR